MTLKASQPGSSLMPPWGLPRFLFSAHSFYFRIPPFRTQGLLTSQQQQPQASRSHRKTDKGGKRGSRFIYFKGLRTRHSWDKIGQPAHSLPTADEWNCHDLHNLIK